MCFPIKIQCHTVFYVKFYWIQCSREHWTHELILLETLSSAFIVMEPILPSQEEIFTIDFKFEFRKPVGCAYWATSQNLNPWNL